MEGGEDEEEEVMAYAAFAEADVEMAAAAAETAEDPAQMAEMMAMSGAIPRSRACTAQHGDTKLPKRIEHAAVAIRLTTENCLLRASKRRV